MFYGDYKLKVVCQIFSGSQFLGGYKALVLGLTQELLKIVSGCSALSQLLPFIKVHRGLWRLVGF